MVVVARSTGTETQTVQDVKRSEHKEVTNPINGEKSGNENTDKKQWK